MGEVTEERGMSQKKTPKRDQKRDQKDLAFIRTSLVKAGEVQDPRELWYVVKELLDLLTMIIVPDFPRVQVGSSFRPTTAPTIASRPTMQ